MTSPNGSHASGLKRKVTEGCATRSCKAGRVGMQHGPSFGSCAQSCHFCPMQPTLADNCFNYLNSGLPRRIMFYSLGIWLDFPEQVVQALIEGFRDDKSSTVVKMDDQPLLVDFLSMTLVNLRTRKQCSVAWIDESDKCFFPALFFDEKANKQNKSACGVMSSSIRRPITEKVVHSSPEVIKQVVVETGVSVSPRPSTAEILRMNLTVLERGSDFFLFAQNLFLTGMGPFAMPNNILHIHRYSPMDMSSQSRYDAFERQIRSTKEERGDANVRYGWLGCRKQDLAEIMIHGFGMAEKTTQEPALGTGVYLTPGDRAFASVNLCDDDEKGIQYILLCRAILGNMEQVQPGSHQNCPSSKKYDSGVDDCLNPKCYVLWSTHLNTSIHLECIISFKLSPTIREYLRGLKDAHFHVSQEKVEQKYSRIHSVKCELSRGPTSPWIPFKVLFDEIQDSISPISRELLFHHHKELEGKIITREELVKKIRIIVGDKLLISTLERLQRRPSSWYGNSYVEIKLEDQAIPISQPNFFATAKIQTDDSAVPNLKSDNSVALCVVSNHSSSFNMEPINYDVLKPVSNDCCCTKHDG
ncbi:inactive poly [ADP-ribose] polymerase RCD1-like [Typha angustifolia]|uniref:inactive poly [ADP-ribose] polymerase RCD1-like n=1 Tax=Typha angustifolia TaxID=59011 RepID=UPI003C2AD3F6